MDSENNESTGTDKQDPESPDHVSYRLLRWLIVLGVGLGVWLLPIPAGITPQSWRLLAIFVATITGSILRPVHGGAVVLMGARRCGSIFGSSFLPSFTKRASTT